MRTCHSHQVDPPIGRRASASGCLWGTAFQPVTLAQSEMSAAPEFHSSPVDDSLWIEDLDGSEMS